MVRKTKAEAEATRSAILDAAAKVFLEQGFAKASLESIAKTAGVTRGAIYWHFKNKLDIFTALHEQLFISTSEMIAAELQRDHPQPLKQLQDLCLKLLIDLETDAHKRRILTIFFLRCDYSGEMGKFLQLQQEKKQQSFHMFTFCFQRAKDKGQLASQTSPDMLTQSLSCFITGIAFEYLRYPELFNLQASAHTLLEPFFAGLTVKT